MNLKCSPPRHLSCFLNFLNSNQVAENVILVHPFFEERVYLHSFKMSLQMECTCLALVNANVFNHQFKIFSEFLFSFLMDSFGNLRTIEIEPRNSAQLPFSFSLDLVGNLRTSELTLFCTSALRFGAWSSTFCRLIRITSTGWHPSSLFSVYNRCKWACQNIVLTLYRLTVDRHNRSNILLSKRSIKMIVVRGFNVCWLWDTLRIVTHILFIVLRIRFGPNIAYNSCRIWTESEYTTELKHIE